jgi:hypothetical protein
MMGRRLRARLNAEGAHLDGRLWTHAMELKYREGRSSVASPSSQRSTIGARRWIWLAPHVFAKLDVLRGPGENYSDVILRLAEVNHGD